MSNVLSRAVNELSGLDPLEASIAHCLQCHVEPIRIVDEARLWPELLQQGQVAAVVRRLVSPDRRGGEGDTGPRLA